MFNWLLLVGTNGKPDATGRGLDIDYPSIIIGFVAGVFLTLLITYFIILLRSIKKDDNKNDIERKE